MPILFIAGLLQRSSEIFGGVVAEFFLERCGICKFARVRTGQRTFEWLMPRKCVEQREKSWLISRGQKSHQTL